MYNENNDSDKTDETNEYSDSLNESSTNDTYGRTFKDYTYSAYDYTSFFDENYGNSSDNSDTASDNHNTSDNLTDNFKTASVPDNSEDNYFSTINNSHSVESDDKVSKAVDINNDISPDSFESFNNLNTVDSYNAFNNSSPNPDNHNDTVSPDDDPTIYLDEFLDAAVNNRPNKGRYLNIPGISIISMAILSFLLMFIGALTDNESLLTIGPILFVLTLIATFIILLFTKYNLSIFIVDSYEAAKGLPVHNIDTYLGLTDKKNFKSHNSYCLNGPTFNVKSKSPAIKYALITVLLVFIAGSIFAYNLQGPELSKVISLDGVLLFPCIGILLMFYHFNSYILLKNGHYNETVNAVCVEVTSRRSHSSDGHSTRIYRPILYGRCNNGHKYIFLDHPYTNTHIPYIGEVVKLKVNSSNPLSYFVYTPLYKNPYFKFDILYFIVSFTMYIWLVFNATF